MKEVGNDTYLETLQLDSFEDFIKLAKLYSFFFSQASANQFNKCAELYEGLYLIKKLSSISLKLLFIDFVIILLIIILLVFFSFKTIRK